MNGPYADLVALGWCESFANAFEAGGHADAGLVPARVVAQDRGAYVVADGPGDAVASLSGRFRFDAADAVALPAVGDWVAVARHPTRSLIHAVLRRRTAIVRRAPGPTTEPQIVGANVDVVLIVTSLNRDLNLRRIERYLAIGWESGAEPVVVLSKADLAEDAVERSSEIEGAVQGVPVLVVSAIDGTGLDDLRQRIRPGRTAAFVGSSGVGKSTLLNAIAGSSIAAVSEVRRDDDRGRHTTTRRQLSRLPGGELILDTPGMREIGLWDTDVGLDASFADLAEVGGDCRFRDCRHDQEPGCAVREAIADGRLDAGRLVARRKLDREVARLERERDHHARSQARRQNRVVQRAVARQMRQKYGHEG